MSLVSKEIKWKNYYYSFLRFRLAKNPKSFSKYIDLKKPSKKNWIMSKIDLRTNWF